MAIERSAVEPGDVLLVHGSGFVSWAIRLFDGTEVNHVAIAMPGGTMAEAGGAGLRRSPLPRPGDGDYVLVHRFSGDAPLDPVVARADALLTEGHLYAYQQIVLLAVLALTRRLPLPRLARRLVRSALDHGARAVMDLLPVGSTWMICSEYVYRCYDEAVDASPDPYLIQIGGLTFAAAEPTLLDWGVDHATDVALAPPTTTFGPAAAVEPTAVLAAAEAELAPLIADYARQLHEAGEIGDDDLPPLADVSFAADAVPGVPEPTDEELLTSMASFGVAFSAARGQPATVATTFGVVGPTIGAAALKGILEGVREITVAADFVTPGDLLRSPSFRDLGRLT